MNEPIKILFDENFGKPLVSALSGFLAWYKEEVIDVKHLFAFVEESEKDEIWVPKIAPGGWTVISTDRAKRCGGRKLPDLCREHKVTHILLSASIHEAKQFEKIRAVLAVLPKIILATRSPKGTRFSLRYDGPDKRVALVERPYPNHPPPIGAPPLLRFDGPKMKRRQAQRPRRRPRKPDDIPMLLGIRSAERDTPE